MPTELDKLIINRIYAVNVIRHKQPVKMTRRDRTLSAIAYKTSGKTIYSREGGNFVSDRGHLVFIPKNRPYSIDCIETGTCYMIEFDCAGDNDDFVSFPVTEPDITEQLFRNIYGVWTMRAAGFEAACMACAYEIFYKVHVGALKSRYTGKRAVLEPALGYLRSHISDPSICNAELARRASVSEVYFRKLFTEEFGVPPMQYVRTLRIEKAKDMLLGDYSSVTNVAEATGFASVYSFCRTFKTTTGFTPTEYARRPRR